MSESSPSNPEALLSALLGTVPSDRDAPGAMLELLVQLASAFQFHEDRIASHLRRISAYVRILAEGLGFDAKRAALVSHASVFHDVGMVDVPRAIVDKRGPLTEDELRVMRQHTIFGHALLGNASAPLLRTAAELALCHHERFDGSGYPNGLRGSEIPVAARIVAVADVFDALTSKRPHKEPYPVHVAREIVVGMSGEHLDPGVVDVLVDHWDSITWVASACDRPLSETLPGSGPPPVPARAVAPNKLRPETFVTSDRDRRRGELFLQGGYFSCPFCRQHHDSNVEICPERGTPLRRVHKLSGTVLDGKYLLQRAAGAGGMGAVYEARQLRLKRRVAIKFLDPAMAKQPTLVKRFLEEARLYATLRHQNVVEVIDIEPDGTLPYMVMEYLEGYDLAALIRNRAPLPSTTTARIGRELLDTLVEVHANGIVHRDLKPDNIFFTDAGARLKLLDFGVSLSTQRGEGARLTEVGTYLGTPEYMSPEQAMGQHTVDHRSDLFSVGALLYEMVTGRVAFLATNMMTTMFRITRAEYVPVRQLAPSIDPTLERVIERALQLDVDARFGSAASFSAALERATGERGWEPGDLALGPLLQSVSRAA